MKKKSSLTSSAQKELVRLVLQAYSKDPLSFSNLLPEVGGILNNIFAPKVLSTQSFGITERERLDQVRLLDALIAKNNQAQLSADEAKVALEKCAILIDSEFLPLSVDHTSILGLLVTALEYSPKSVDKKTDVAFSQEIPAREVFVIRGVKLSLTWDYRLLAINIIPTYMKERNSLLTFVGIIERENGNE